MEVVLLTLFIEMGMHKQTHDEESHLDFANCMALYYIYIYIFRLISFCSAWACLMWMFMYDFVVMELD
jgi:hypothetical protein